MTRKVVVSKIAEQDIEQILSHYRDKVGYQIARNILDGLIQSIQILSNPVYVGPSVFEHNNRFQSYMFT